MMSKGKSDKKDTLKTTGVIASSQILIIIIGIVKTKIFAIILGPSGIGILGLYQSTIDLIRNFSGFGLNLSSVREISNSKMEIGSNDLEFTWAIIKKWMFFSSIFGVIFVLIFSKKISILAFGTNEFYLDFALLSLTIPLGIYYVGRISFLQGVRNINLLAKTQIFSALGAAITTVPLIVFWGNDAIVLSIVFFWIVQFSISVLLSNRLLPKSVRISNLKAFKSGKKMMSFGSLIVLALMISALTIYAIRLFISNKSSVYDVGLFQAAVTLSTVYLMTILQAMSADYYPSLSSNQKNSKKLIEISNNQLEIVLNLASTLIISMLIFLPLIIEIFYSKDFLKSLPMIQWMLGSSFFRVIGYPLSYLLLAKGSGVGYFIGEFLFNVLYFSIIFLFWDFLGLEAIGIGLASGYIFYFLFYFIFVKIKFAFSLTKSNIQSIWLNFFLVLITFLVARYLNNWIGIIIQMFILIISIVSSFKYMDSIFDVKKYLHNLTRRNN